ncbi:MAG TPA: Smr/MutS family protein [Kofleriaceae bacterium]|jgi:DNA mismatch repair protein MutS2
MRIASKTLEDLGWPTLVEHWAKRCATERGAAAVRAMPWFEAIEDARERAAEIKEARELAAQDARLPLGGIVEIAGAIARVRKAASLEAPELVAVAQTGRSLARLRTHLREHSAVAPRLSLRAEAISDLGHVYHPILDAFDADGRLVDHASEALGPLRRSLASIRATLERRMAALLTDERFAQYLQDAYYTQREDRYVLPVRTDGKGFVHGIVHGTSQSGQTLFIEPEEIVDLNNRAKLAEAEVADEERRIFARFSGWIAEEAGAFDLALEAAEAMDVVASAAILADDTVAAEPVLVPEPRVALLHARHPLMLLGERRCVANDITIGAGITLLVSGPNAGGKTVALKTAGLAALMARVGLHLTAEPGSIIGWFPDVRTDMGDAQSLEHDLSTFSGHMVRLRELLATAGAGSLLLVDEIAVGTDPDQGAALAQAVLEALAGRGVTAIVTTHYERLKALGATDPRFANASVGYDLARLEPTFKLHLGVPGSSGALAVATRMGIANGIVERARELIGAQGARVEDLLASVAENQKRLEEERAALLAELEAVEADRAASRVHREKSAQKYEKQVRTAHGEAVVALRQARREIDDVRRDVRAKQASERATADDVKQAVRRLVTPGSMVAKLEPQRPLPPGTPAKPEQLVPGAWVIVPRLGRAEVVSVADDKVEVRMGSMRALVPAAEILIDSHREARKKSPHPSEQDTIKPESNRITLVDAAPPGGRANARTMDTTIDVRGNRADEAISQLDRFVDESILAGREAVFIIHGHGTGALRQAVRAHLATNKAIATLRPGEPTEGGDGVTVAFLRG